MWQKHLFPKGLDVSYDLMQREYGHSLSVFYFFMSLLSCKNISVSDVIPGAKLQRRRERSGRLPLVTYKVLNVSSVKGGSSDMVSQESGTAKTRVHVCRGHFKEYTADAPLFGRITGRFWWQPTVRGAGYGVVVKDYKVDAGTNNKESGAAWQGGRGMAR